METSKEHRKKLFPLEIVAPSESIHDIILHNALSIAVPFLFPHELARAVTVCKVWKLQGDHEEAWRFAALNLNPDRAARR